MAFQVKNWQNYPNPPYIVDGPGMQDLETRLSSYTDTSIQNIPNPNYANFYSTATQTATTAGSAYAVTYNGTGLVSGFAVNSNSQITPTISGKYNFQFDMQLNTNKSDTLNFWLRVNGSDVSNSGAQVSFSNQSSFARRAWSYILNLNAGDHVELWWASQNGGAQLTYSSQGAVGVGPAIPSIEVNVLQIATVYGYGGTSTAGAISGTSLAINNEGAAGSATIIGGTVTLSGTAGTTSLYPGVSSIYLNGITVYKIPFGYQTANIATGAPLFYPQTGWQLRDISVQVTTPWNALASADIGLLTTGGSGFYYSVGNTNGQSTSLYPNMQTSSSTAFTGLSHAANKPQDLLNLCAYYNQPYLPSSFVGTAPLCVCVTQNGLPNGAASTSTAGSALLIVTVANPATHQ
jgi:hypothetical protein